MNPGINAASAIRQDGTTLLFVGKIILEFKNDGYLYYQDEKVEYTVNDDQLTIKMDDGEPLVATITELTNKELVFEAEDFNSESGIASSIALYFKRA